MIKVKVRRERRDPIELLTDVRQRLESVDLINDSTHAEQLQQFTEQRNAIDVEAHNGVAKVLQDEQEESASTTEVENTFGRRAMKIQILHAFTIQSQPRLDICIFGIARCGIRISLLDLSCAVPVNLREHWPERHAKKRALRSAPAAPVGQLLGEFEDFAGELHFKI